MTSRLYLVNNGVDLDVAFSLQDQEVAAWCIIFGKFKGSEWDWSSMSWRDPK